MGLDLKAMNDEGDSFEGAGNGLLRCAHNDGGSGRERRVRMERQEWARALSESEKWAYETALEEARRLGPILEGRTPYEISLLIRELQSVISRGYRYQVLDLDR